MPGKRPAASGYARLAQAEADDDDAYSDDEDPFKDPANILSSPTPKYAPIQFSRRDSSMRLPDNNASLRSSPGHRRRANSGIDIKAINARLERWADEIKERFKRRRVKGKSTEEEQLEIHHSVFHAPDWIRPATKESLETDYDDAPERMSKLEFDDIVESVRTAIELGLHPTLILQGSSGSYFARNSGGKVVGVFKPKDEEPYASKNPKWTKWIHRNLFPFAFGRAMLIPNLSYVSEAAAYVLDCQLRTNIVPYTDVVSFSSKSFHYDWMDRRAYYRKGRAFPEKQGSFQVFLKGFKGATDFFKEHPWPDQQSAEFRDAPAKKRRRKRWDETCRPTSRASSRPTTSDGSTAAGYDTDDEEEDSVNEHTRSPQEFWSEDLQQSFREELEKLVILDYVMRNTDRGSDNWMIRIDKTTNKASIVKKRPGQMDTDGYSRRDENMTANSRSPSKHRDEAVPRLGAIDNSLSWPWKHPDAWRSYPFGWLFMPVSLIGRPFSDKTRKHFLPLLTSKEWWSETQVKLRQCFELDADFQERMFARQMAVMKGQAWNVVETLKTPDHGPLELTRRNRVHVWDDIVDIPVAVSLPRASEEMRRRAAAANAQVQRRMAERGSFATSSPRRQRHIEEEEGEEEEMDISSALTASAPAMRHGDLLGMTSSLPNDVNNNRFNHSRQNSAQDDQNKESRAHGELIQDDTGEITSLTPSTPKTRPDAPRRSRTGNSNYRLSHDLSRSAPRASKPRTRRFSLGFSRRQNSSLSLPFYEGRGHGDEDDDGGYGDLGYAATAEREGDLRKVIVERLEMVRGREPVFTWC